MDLWSIAFLSAERLISGTLASYEIAPAIGSVFAIEDKSEIIMSSQRESKV